MPVTNGQCDSGITENNVTFLYCGIYQITKEKVGYLKDSSHFNGLKTKDNAPFKGKKQQLPKGEICQRIAEGEGFQRHIDTLRIASPPAPHRRSTQVAGTSEQVLLITQATTKLPCQQPSTKVMHTSAHPGVLWEEPHQNLSINHLMATGAGRHSMWTLTVLRVLTPLGLGASSWRSCLARQSSLSPDPCK